MLDADNPNTGLTILRASRLEALLKPFQTLLEATQPESLLAPQTVIAAHPGMRQWLVGELARQVGPGRIVANLDVCLTSTWLDAVSNRMLGQRAVSLTHYRRVHLRWSVHALLDQARAHGITDARVLNYLDAAGDADQAALRRFQLADRLAQVYSQYLIYRPDWLDAWERGVFRYATTHSQQAALTELETRCLAPLWRALFQQLGEHRGRLMHTLAEALAHHATELPPLHVFGLSHLPPIELAVLRQYARRAPVFLYVPDPCREYWGGLHRSQGEGRWRAASPDWAGYRTREAELCADPNALDTTAHSHPLLALWGRMGQHFFAALADGEVREDTRHWQDEHDTAPANRLERVQHSLRRLDPALMAEDPSAATGAHDASLRVHACHTRLRELEVLRDALLDAIDRDAVKPWNIVVMAPDIHAYAPLIPAVFGQAGSPRERLLPYHLADVPLLRSHRLLTTFTALLQIAQSRITAPQVVDLLGVPEVRRALSLNDDDSDTLIEWLRASGVAWGLDGEHKTHFALPPTPDCSFDWAMDRFFAGYTVADAEDEPTALILPDGAAALPMLGIQGPAVSAIGSLDRLLQTMRDWMHLAQSECSASQWAAELRQRVDAMFQIDDNDAEAKAALDILHRALAALALEPAGNGHDPLLRMPVVRAVIQEQLAASAERQSFLPGGITFCGMVPQRAIPFDVVCVLGLDEGSFPRRIADGGIDLMARLPRVGDRDVVLDDRYLFLETLMSARKRLHLSYIGQGVRDGKPRNPATPLAELLAELDYHAGLAVDAEAGARPWWVKHPLQPFDPRYFDGQNPALFSYSSTLLGIQSPQRTAAPRLRDAAMPAPLDAPEIVPMSALTAYFKQPARALLRERLHISLDGVDADARLPEDEPLESISPPHAVARTVFLQHVLPQQCADPDWRWDRSPPDWVRHGGIMPVGRSGMALWQAQAAAVVALCEHALASARFDARSQHGAAVVAIDLVLPAVEPALPTIRISGSVHAVYPLKGHDEGVQLVLALPDPRDSQTSLKSPNDLDFASLVPCFLDWLALRLQQTKAVPVRCTILAQAEPDMACRINAWDQDFCAAPEPMRAIARADLQARLRALLAFWQAGLSGANFYYPKTAWKALQAHTEQQNANDEHPVVMDLAALGRAIAATWAGSDFHIGERDYGAGFARVLEGALDFGDSEGDPDHAMLKSLLDAAQRLQNLILLPPILSSTATEGTP